MRPPDHPELSPDHHAETTVVDALLFDKLLRVASAAYVFRHQYTTFFQRQAELVQQGYALEEIVRISQDAFGALQRAEERLFAAVDELNALTPP